MVEKEVNDLEKQAFYRRKSRNEQHTWKKKVCPH
jgi:hypothetical protein